MTDAPAITVINQIKAALETIREDDGFHTDAGREVVRGFLSHAIKATDKRHPFIVIQTDSEGLDTPGTLQGKVALSLTLFVVDKSDHPDRLQSAVSDLRKALVALEFTRGTAITGSLTTAPAAYNPNPESNFSLAALPVTVNFMETYAGE